MSKKRSEYDIFKVGKTKLWKELLVSTAIAGIIAIAAVFVLQYGLNYLIEVYIDNPESQRHASDVVMAEFQAYVLEHNLSIYDKEKVMDWEKKKKAEIYFGGTYELIHYIEQTEKKYENTVITTGLYEYGLNKYKIRFRDGVIISYPILGDVKKYYDFATIFSLAFAAFLFAIILLGLVKKRLNYVIRLCEEMKILEAGNLEYEISVKGKDELADIGRGINNMRRAVLERIQKEREAITSNHDLITAMSHDLRTPLTKQIGYLEILFRDKYSDEAEKKEFIEKARKNAFIMKDTTDKLFKYFLAFSEKETLSNHYEVNGKQVLNQILKEQIEYITNLGFVVFFEEIKEEFQLKINSEEFARIFDNLFQNIRKYGEISIPVEISYLIQGSEIFLMIQNGVKQDISMVESTKIGLKVVGKIVKSMNGNMEMMNDGKFFAIQLIFQMI